MLATSRSTFSRRVFASTAACPCRITRLRRAWSTTTPGEKIYARGRGDGERGSCECGAEQLARRSSSVCAMADVAFGSVARVQSRAGTYQAFSDDQSLLRASWLLPPLASGDAKPACIPRVSGMTMRVFCSRKCLPNGSTAELHSPLSLPNARTLVKAARLPRPTASSLFRGSIRASLPERFGLG